jgi:hypothetical protein
MILSGRTTLAVLAVTTLSVAVGPLEGCYSRGAMAGTLLALALALAACLGGDGAFRVPTPLKSAVLGAALLIVLAWCGDRFLHHKKDHLSKVLGLVGLWATVASAWGWRQTGSGSEAVVAASALLLTTFGALLDKPVLYGEVAQAVGAIPCTSAAGFLALALLLPDVSAHPQRRPGFWSRVALIFATGLLVRASAIWASPAPVIDVFAWLRDAPAHLLEGRNPYSATYESPYATDRARRYLLDTPAEAQPAAYPPLPILLTLPVAAVHCDVRYVNVVADGVAALALVLAGGRRRPLLGALAAGLYLHLPRVPFLIEQGWYEPMLAAALGLGLVLIERGWRLGYVFVGLGLTGKQFGMVLLAPFAAARRGHGPTVWTGIGIASALTIMPFLLWSPHDFLDVVLFRHLDRPVSLTSITLTSAVHDLLGATLPRWLTWLAAALAVGGLTWRTPSAATAAGLWMGTALLVFCVLHTQGHFNYFYLCQYLWLLGIVGISASAPGA